jgi:hypothetical protein
MAGTHMETWQSRLGARSRMVTAPANAGHGMKESTRPGRTTESPTMTNGDPNPPTMPRATPTGIITREMAAPTP